MRKVASVVSLDGFRIDVDEPLLPRHSGQQHISPDCHTHRHLRGRDTDRDSGSIASLRQYDLSKHAMRQVSDRLPTDRVRDKKRRIEWLELDCDGFENTIWADKRGICAQKGLKPPVRDLRVLDPAFISPGSGYLLARDKCIIVALEHVRMIIMKDRVLLPMKHCADISQRDHSGDIGYLQERPCSKRLHSQLVQHLKRQTKLYSATGGSMEEGVPFARSSTYSNFELLDTFSERMSPSAPSQINIQMDERSTMLNSSNGYKPLHTDPTVRPMNGDAFKEDPEAPFNAESQERDRHIIPFEHAILEIALSHVTKRLANATDKLDANRQVVDALTSNVDRATLVSVRMLKNEQQELLDRVSVVLECLEHAAEEKTLANLCLAHKDALQVLDQTMRSAGVMPSLTDAAGFNSMQCGNLVNVHSQNLSQRRAGLASTAGGLRSSAGGALGAMNRSRSAQNCVSPTHSQPGEGGTAGYQHDDRRTSFEQVSHQSQLFEVDEWDVQRRAVRGMFMNHVQHMEALVDSNFIEAHACQHKLQSLGKYITDVEAFVNIHMDAVRNRMIKFEILLMVGTFALGVYAVIAGILGENIPLAPESLVDSEDGFLLINVLVSMMCMAIFVCIMVCARRNGLM